jgi:hypothetical protein
MKGNFVSTPPEQIFPNYNWGKTQLKEWVTIEEKWLANGVIQKVERKDCHLVCAMYLKPEPTKWRPIFDGRPLNKHIQIPKLRYETLRDVRLLCE